MTERLLDCEKVRCASIQAGCKAMSQGMWRDPLVNARFSNPLIEAALDLPSGYSAQHLAEEERLAFNEDLLTFFQMVMQDGSHFSVEESIDDLPTLGSDCYLLLDQVDIANIKADELREPDTGMQEEGHDNQIAPRLQALMRSDGLQQNTFLIFSQENGQLTCITFDANTACGIMIELSGISQPTKESFDGCPGAVNG